MKLFSRLLLAFVAVVVAAIVAGAAIIMTTDTQQVAAFISERVKAATGRELTIAGDIDMKLSLVPTLSAADVRFGNAPWGSRPEMARLERLEVGLELLPLLSGDIRLSEVTLVGPDILLEVNGDGTPNWLISVNQDTAEKARAIEREAEEIYGLPVLERLAIEGAVVRFSDATRDIQERLELTRLDLSSEATGERMRLDVAGAVAALPFTVGGSITSLYRLVEDPRFFVFDLLVTGLGAAGEAKGVVRAPLTDREVDIKLTLRGSDLVGTIAQARSVVPKLPQFELPAIRNYEAAVRLVGTPRSLSAEGIEFSAGEAGGLAVALTGSASSLVGPGPQWRFSARAEVPDPSAVSRLAGYELPSKPAVRIEAVVSNPDHGLAVDNLSLRVGETTLTGNAVLEGVGQRPKVTAALKADRLPVSELMAFLPKGAEEKQARQVDDSRVIPSISLAPPPLPDIEVALRLVMNEVVVDDLSVEDLAASVNMTPQDIEIGLARAKFGSGTWSGRVGVSLGDGSPKLAGDLTVKDARIENLLAYATDHRLVDGPLEAKFTVTGQGSDLRTLLAGLNGDVEVVMHGGGVANKYVDLLAGDLVQEIVPWVAETKEARINCFVSRFDIKDGIATSTGLLFDTDKVAIGGGGTIDLRDETLNMRINPKPKQESLVSLAFPVDIKGTFKSPKAAPTPGAVAKGVAGLALGLVNPLAILLAVADRGDNTNNCMAALEATNLAPLPTAEPPQADTEEPPQDSSVVKDVIGGVGKGLENVEEGIEKGIKGIGKGIGGAIRGILGGKK